MNKNTMKYRDLDPEERHEPGDEFSPAGGDWEALSSAHVGLLVGNVGKCRRPIKEPAWAWIPISTLPTEADGDKHGQVLARKRDMSVAAWHWTNVDSPRTTPHWMRIPPLPEPPKNEELADSIVSALATRSGTSAIKVVLDVLNKENQE
jgi:hypothetical protein